MNCASKISTFLEPIIEKRKYYENNIDEVKNILSDGEEKGRAEAQKTMAEVREKMKMG
jgi:tryptophanyl-tRNA synthetase